LKKLGKSTAFGRAFFALSCAEALTGAEKSSILWNMKRKTEMFHEPRCKAHNLVERVRQLRFAEFLDFPSNGVK
jgi:hypothetical protein